MLCGIFYGLFDILIHVHVIRIWPHKILFFNFLDVLNLNPYLDYRNVNMAIFALLVYYNLENVKL